MSTDPQADNELDARLRRAGEAWRRELRIPDVVFQEPAWPGDSADQFPAARRLSRSARARRAAAPLAAAAGVALIATATILITDDHPPKLSSGAMIADLAVTDGDQVDATGELGFDADRRLILCAKPARKLFEDGSTKAAPPVPPMTCPPELTTYLTGVSATPQGVSLRPTGPVLAGRIVFTGVLHGQTIAVTGLRQAPPPDPPALSLPLHPPCPTPPGGWQPANGMSYTNDEYKVDAWAAEHAETFGLTWISHPTDGKLYPNAEGGNSPLDIITIGTTDDVNTAYQQLSALTSDPLCVYPTENSRSQLASAERTARSVVGPNLLHASPNLISGLDKVEVNVRLLTPAAANALQPFATQIRLTAQITPAKTR